MDAGSASEGEDLPATAAQRERRGRLESLLEDEDLSKDFEKWESMASRGLSRFGATHPLTFARRAKRGIPQRFRWEAWKLIVSVHPSPPSAETGNGEDAEDGIPREATIPSDTTDDRNYADLAASDSPSAPYIGIDVPRTFPELAIFDEEAQKKLFRILNAFAVSTPTVGYCQGMNFIAGLILLVSNFNEEESFHLFRDLMVKYELEGMYHEQLPLLRRYLSAFEAMGRQHFPRVQEHFTAEEVDSPMFIYPWFLCLFVTSVPLRTVTVIWDYILCEGLPAMILLAVSLIKLLSQTLVELKCEKILTFLKSMRVTTGNSDRKVGHILVRRAMRMAPLPSEIHVMIHHVPKSVLLDEVLTYQNCRGGRHAKPGTGEAPEEPPEHPESDGPVSERARRRASSRAGGPVLSFFKTPLADGGHESQQRRDRLQQRLKALRRTRSFSQTTIDTSDAVDEASFVFVSHEDALPDHRALRGKLLSSSASHTFPTRTLNRSATTSSVRRKLLSWKRSMQEEPADAVNEPSVAFLGKAERAASATGICSPNSHAGRWGAAESSVVRHKPSSASPPSLSPRTRTIPSTFVDVHPLSPTRLEQRHGSKSSSWALVPAGSFPRSSAPPRVGGWRRHPPWLAVCKRPLPVSPARLHPPGVSPTDP